MLRAVGAWWLAAVLWLAAPACSSDSPGLDGGDTGTELDGGIDGSSAAEAALNEAGEPLEGGSPDVAVAQDAQPGPDARIDGAVDGASVDDPARCPRTLLPPALPIQYDGSTLGLADLVHSTPLEWRDAPDDTLRFVVPASGRYRFAFEDPSGNDGCGVSIGDKDGFFEPSICPAASTFTELDGFYVAGGGFSSEVALSAGQDLLIIVSCTYWSDVQAGTYQLRIERL